MNILITGGAGYIGSLLTKKLLDLNYKITIIDRLDWGIKPILQFIDNKNLTVIKEDIRNYKLIEKLIKENDLIIQLAGIVGFPACSSDPINAQSINEDASNRICEISNKYNKKIIYSSTGSIYGRIKNVVDENTKPNPLTLYGTTKYNAEKVVLKYGGVALRFATIFGLSTRLRLDLLVNDFCYQAYHLKQIVMFEGHFRRSFLHVKDAANSIVHAVEKYDNLKGLAFNIGDESMNFTKKEVALKIKSIHNYTLIESEIGTDQDKRDYEISYAKFKDTGFKIQYDIDKGIKEMFKVIPLIKFKNSFYNA